MIRRLIAGPIAAAGLATIGWVLFARRNGARSSGQDAVQWPFDADELRSLMSKVVDEQSARISLIQDAAGRSRAQAFLDYYERRRRAVAS